MVQNEINNMSFLTADNKSKMAKVGALLWEVDLAGREGTPPRASYVPLQLPHPGHIPCSPHSFLLSHVPFPLKSPLSHVTLSPLLTLPTESGSGSARLGDVCRVGQRGQGRVNLQLGLGFSEGLG